MLALFAVALAGTGLLTTVGVIVAMDTFGPVSDNAQGIAEMSGDVEGAGAQVLTDLDAVGNTTKAITKGIAIATAVLAAAALFGSYRDAIATGASATSARRSGDGAPMNLDDGHLAAQQPGRPDRSARRSSSSSRGWRSTRCRGRRARWSTRCGGSSASTPGSWTTPRSRSTAASSTSAPRTRCASWPRPVCSPCWRPIAVGFTLGVGALGSFLAGAIGTGTLMAVFLANSGGAWDNAKKLVEDGHHGGKGSEAHAATVIGDTVGDPFKDTAGPAINPLLKVMNLVALLIAPAVDPVQLRRRRERRRAGRGRGARASRVIVGAVYVSKRRGIAVGDEERRRRAARPSRPIRRWFRSRGRTGGLAQEAGGRRVLTCRPPAVSCVRPCREPSLSWCKWLQ